MKTTDMRAKARAIFGPAIAEPMPNQPNGAKALQQRANARPIPTYKVGGVVKKPMPTPAASAASGNRMSKQEGDEMRFMDMMEKKKKSSMPSPAASAASGNRVAKQEGDEMRKMKMKTGGKAGKYAVGGAPARFNPTQALNQFGADLARRVKAGTMTVAQARAAQSQFRNQVQLNTKTPQTLGSASATAANIMRNVMTPQPNAAAAYRDTGARLNAQVKAGQITPQQATAIARPAFMATTGANAPTVQATMAKAAQPVGRKKGGKVQTSSDTARKLATEMGGYKKGGKVKQVDVDMKMLEEMSRPKMSLPNLESKAAEARNLNAVRAKETSDAAKGKSFKEKFAEEREKQGPNGVFTWRGNTYNTKMAGETSKAGRAAAPAPRAAAPTPAPATRGNPPAAAAPASRPAAKPPATPAKKSGNASSSMSSVIRNLDSGYDLDAEAKKIMAKRNDSFFRSPISMKEAREEARAEAENVRKMSGYRAEQERKKKSLEAGRKANPDLVSRFVDMTMNPGYKKGGKVKEAKPKNGLAVMIAIGKPMKPAKKMNGGAMASGSKDMEASKVTRAMADGGDPMGYMGGGSPMGYAAGGAGKTRKGQAPIKKAQGGAAKVRKGMMTPEGDIINVMNKMRGK